MKPIVLRTNTLEQWRLFCNRVSDNLGDPDLLYTSDVPNNTGVVYNNTSDSYTHPANQLNAIQAALNDLNSRKVKRSGDTITGHLNIKQNFSVDGNVTLGTDGSNTINIRSTAVSIPNNLNFDANTLYLDSTNDRVGIGQVPSGSERLQVTGNTKLTGTLQVTSTSQFDGNVTIGSSKVTVAASTGNTIIAGSFTQNGTGNLSVTTTGTATISPTSTTTIGTAGQTTTLLGNVSATTNNQTITLSPTGTGTVTINPATTGTINNVNIGGTTRGTGAFTTLTANNAVTFTQNTGSTSTTTGTLVVTGGTGISENLFVGGVVRSDTIASLTNNTNLALSGTGTGIVQINDDLSVVGSITVSTGDIILSTGSDVVQTILSGVSGSTANLFTNTNTDTLNVGDNAAVNIGNVSKTTTIRGATTISGALSCSSTATVTGATTLNGNVTASGSNATITLSPTGTGTVTINPATTGTINNVNIGGTTRGTGAFTTLNINGQLTSTVSTGTAPFVIASTTKVTNLNADLLDGADWAAPLAIGSTTPAAGSFTTLSASSGITGTLQTTSQPNITSVGTLTSLSVSGDSTFNTNTVVRVSTLTTTTTSETVIASFAGGTFRSCEFIIQGVDSTNNKYCMSKVLVVHNGTTADYVEYGRIELGGMTFTSLRTNYNAGTVELLATPSTASSTVWKITMFLTKV